MKQVRFLVWAGLLIVLALPLSNVLAAPADNWAGPLDRIITGEDYVLESGEVERGAIVILGGAVTIEEGAVVDGDMTALGGDVDIGGTVDGSVLVFGGTVNVYESAVIDGDCVLFGGQVRIDESAQIDGEVVTNPEGRWLPFGWLDRDFSIPEIPAVPEVPAVPQIPDVPVRPRVVYHHRTSFAERVGGAFLTAIGVGIAALLITLFWPRHTDRVRSTIVREPVASGLVGFVTLLAAGLLTPVALLLSAILIVLLCVGLLGFPLIAAAWLVILAAGLFGWAAVGLVAGRWMAKRLNLQGTTPALEAGLGAFTVSLLLGIVQAIWLVGLAASLALFVISCIALGAVVLTRFGRRDYQKGQAILPTKKRAPAESPQPSEPAAGDVSTGGQPTEPEGDAAEEEEGNQLRFDAPPLESEGPFPEK
jgi:hypothetical protein